MSLLLGTIASQSKASKALRVDRVVHCDVFVATPAGTHARELCYGMLLAD